MDRSWNLMASLTISGIWLLMKETTPIILFWYILENLSGIGLFRFQAELKIQTLFKTSRPCNCAACPRIASELSKSAENNFLVIDFLCRTEAKNKLGCKIQTLLKNCNYATSQELSGIHLFPFFPIKTFIRHTISSNY